MSFRRRRRRGPAAGLGIAAVVALMAGAVLPAVTANAQIAGGIQFLNPGPRNPMDPQDNRGHTQIVSDRTAGGEERYRFAAWVESVPADPVVEFEIDVSAIETRTLGTAVQRGNVFELSVDIEGIVDGNYTLRANLFSGANQVGQDEQAIQLRHGELDSSAAAPRVRIVNMEQGGQLGFYTPPGSDVATTLIDVAASGGATRVRGFFTTTPVGQEPAWALCANETTGGAANGLHCNLPAGADPTTVTAVAAVANTNRNSLSRTGDPPDDQAGDAVHVTPYIQVPTQVVPSEPLIETTGSCPSFQAQVLDQTSKRMTRVNVDFHAVGPSDNLRFDVGSLATILLAPDAKPPDMGPHTFEQGYDCVGERISPDEGFQQGDHNRPVLADIKHIETFSGTGTSGSGTEDTGFVTEFIRSPDAGDTHVTMWADLNDDDLWSSGEPCGVTATRWFSGEEPESPPTPDAEFEGCTIGTPDPIVPPGETPPSSVDLSPDQRTAATGDVQTLTMTARDAQGNPTPNEPVTWQSDGVGEIVEADERTDSGGRAQIQVTSEDEGEQTITVSTNRCASGGTCSDSSEVTWSDAIVQSGPCRGFAEGSRQPREDGDGEVIVGTPGEDNLLGTPGDDIICGLRGADVIEGFEGDDLLVGGSGPDTITGGPGNDRIRGGGGRDVMRGQGGADRISGGVGRDELRGHAGNDRLFGGKGNDRLLGGRGFDRCTGGPGSDRFRGCERTRG